MAFLGQTYSKANLPESTSSYEPIPEGWYAVKIANAELNATKSGTGQYIKMRFDVTGPTHQGRVIFGNLNIRNANPKAEEIGLKQLNELMSACGLSEVQDTDQLLGYDIQVKVSIRPAEGQYEAQNEVKGFKSMSGSAAPAPVNRQAAPVQTSQVAPNRAAPPWQK